MLRLGCEKSRIDYDSLHDVTHLLTAFFKPTMEKKHAKIYWFTETAF